MYRDLGFSLIELVVALAIVSIMLGIAGANLKEMVNPAQNASAEVAAFMKQARARAISTTSAYTVEASSPRQLIAKFGINCSDVNTTNDDTLIVNLPDDVTLTSTTWSICFSSRGLADSNIVVSLEDAYGSAESIEVYLGGAVEIHD